MFFGCFVKKEKNNLIILISNLLRIVGKWRRKKIIQTHDVLIFSTWKDKICISRPTFLQETWWKKKMNVLLRWGVERVLIYLFIIYIDVYMSHSDYLYT